VPAVELPRRPRYAVAAIVILLASACGGTKDFENLMGVGVCDPTASTFVEEIDNPFFPLPVGHRVVLEGEQSGLNVLVRMTVLDETETVAGVETRVVEEYEAENGKVVEISRNFFAQTGDGTVCYFGETVDEYDGSGAVTSHSGAWRADGERFLPGIFMPASLTVGQAFRQEIAPGIAEDQSKVVALGESTQVPAGTFTDTATLLDRNPLGGGEDTKVYARGIGLIVDEAARLTDYSSTT
jgi:hypothetical protein